MRNTIVSILLCATAGTAAANGFVLNDHGAAATGRAEAVVATDADGSAIVHNVAGIAKQEGVNIYLGASLIFPKSTFDCTNCDPGTTVSTDTESPMSVTPQVYATYRINKLVAAGVGFHTPFGSKIVWPESGPTTDEIISQSLRTFFITPSVALNLGTFVSGLTAGVGLDIVPATVELRQHVFFGAARGEAHLGGNALGVGFRAGVQYQPARVVKGLSLGLAYKSRVKLDFEGTGDFDIEDPYRGQLPPDGDISTSITLPMSVLAGVAYRPVPQFEVELDAVWMQWSSFDQLVINLPAPAMPLVSPRDYNDTTSIRLGFEYNLPRVALDLRAGYMYDPSPVPADRLTPSLPDIDRHDLAFGASYHLSTEYKIDVGALWVLPGSRDTAMGPTPTYKGTYDVTAFVGAVTLAGRFGVPPKTD